MDLASSTDALQPDSPTKGMKSSCLLTVLQASMFLVASVGLNVSFPLWMGVIVPNGSDSYYVWFFISGVNAAFWGACVGIGLLSGHLHWKALTVPHWKTFLAGAWYAQNGLYVYGADPTRTPQNLMPMLTIKLPYVMLVRAFRLGRYPVGKQKLGVAVVLLGLLVCISPDVFGLNQTGDGRPSDPHALLWCLFVMFTVLGDAFTDVYAEEILEAPQVPMVYYLFWMELWHFIFVICLFWTDLIPGLGYASSLEDMAAKFVRGWEITFSGGATTWLGVIFLFFWAMQTSVKLALIRFGDGATWSALVQALSTPMKVLLLSILQVSKSGVAFDFSIDIGTCINMLGACFSVPGILLYDRATRKLQSSQQLLDIEAAPTKSLRTDSLDVEHGSA